MSAKSGSRTVVLEFPMAEEIAAFERVSRFLKWSKRAREVRNFGKTDLLWADANRAIREHIAILKNQQSRVSVRNLAGIARAKGAL